MMDKANRFLDNMVSYGLGKVVDEMADLQLKIVEAVRETGKVGELTLKLKFKRSGPHGMMVDPSVTSKVPKHPIKQVEMFADEENILHDSDPNQLTHDNVEVVDFKNRNVNEV
jgi:hypothetical protein